MKFDKYLLVSIVSAILLISFALNYSGNDDESDSMIGVVSNVSRSSSGFLLDISDEYGNEYHCYSKESVETGMICSFTGNYSSDNSIIFISSIEECKL